MVGEFLNFPCAWYYMCYFHLPSYLIWYVGSLSNLRKSVFELNVYIIVGPLLETESHVKNIILSHSMVDHIICLK